MYSLPYSKINQQITKMELQSHNHQNRSDLVSNLLNPKSSLVGEHMVLIEIWSTPHPHLWESRWCRQRSPQPHILICARADGLGTFWSMVACFPLCVQVDVKHLPGKGLSTKSTAADVHFDFSVPDLAFNQQHKHQPLTLSRTCL